MATDTITKNTEAGLVHISLAYESCIGHLRRAVEWAKTCRDWHLERSAVRQVFRAAYRDHPKFDEYDNRILKKSGGIRLDATT